MLRLDTRIRFSVRRRARLPDDSASCCLTGVGTRDVRGNVSRGSLDRHRKTPLAGEYGAPLNAVDIGYEHNGILEAAGRDEHVETSRYSIWLVTDQFRSSNSSVASSLCSSPFHVQPRVLERGSVSFDRGRLFDCCLGSHNESSGLLNFRRTRIGENFR